VSGGLDVSSTTVGEVEESVGAAVDTASRLGGAGTAAIVDRAGVAFTDAFSLAALVAVAVVVAAGLLVLRTFTRAKENAAAEASPIGEGALVDLAPSEVAAD
jgi:MFS transporter, DHA2 family, multidrug resistance protein